MNDKTNLNEEWKTSDAEVFWGEIAPCDHVLQIYESDDVMMDSLEAFVTTGLKNKESVIIIATKEHLKGLNRRLILHGFDLKELQKDNQFIPLDAEEALELFMINNWPDEARFTRMVESLILRAQGKGKRKVRAYGEMVAILWAKGLNGATVHLEHLWNNFCETELFCLFCAYPKSGFTQDANESIHHICSSHNRLLDGYRKSTTHVFHKRS
jgi:hypothetical protein